MFIIHTKNFQQTVYLGNESPPTKKYTLKNRCKPTLLIRTYTCSVPVCEECICNFGRINYGWLTWFAIILIWAVYGAVKHPEEDVSVEGNMGIYALYGALLGLFPSIFVGVKYVEKTEDWPISESCPVLKLDNFNYPHY